MNHALSPAPPARYYTATERAIIREHYPASPRETILALCVGRTWKSIKLEARNLNLSRLRPTTWPPAHLEVLREYYPSGGASAVRRLTGRPASTIHGKAWELGIGYEGKRGAKPGAPRRTAEVLQTERLAAKKARKMVAPKVFVTAPAPQAPKPASIKTPVLNAAKAAKAAAEKQDKAKQVKLAIVPATEIAKLPYTHPARMAYTVNARHGGAAASQAYHQVMSTLK